MIGPEPPTPGLFPTEQQVSRWFDWYIDRKLDELEAELLAEMSGRVDALGATPAGRLPPSS